MKITEIENNNLDSSLKPQNEDDFEKLVYLLLLLLLHRLCLLQMLHMFGYNMHYII